MNRHITLRVDANLPTTEGIDAAITVGLQQLAEQHKESMELVSTSSMYQPHNGTIFVTVIAKGTGKVRAVRPKEAKE